MPHFSNCCPGRDTYVCQQCGAIKCSGCQDGNWTKVPRTGREGNVCHTCMNAATPTNANDKLTAQQLFSDQRQIYNDACDVGIILNERTDKLTAQVREIITRNNPTVTKWDGGMSWDFGSFEISWNNDRVRNIEFLSLTAK